MAIQENKQPSLLTSSELAQLEKNIVWIFASPRSGTTWMASQLLSHNTKIFGEPLIGSHLADSRELGSTFIRRFEEQHEREHYFFCDQYKYAWQPFVRKLILSRVHAQFQTLDTPIIIKEPNGSMAADMISQCLPNSKILVLVRDGRDVLNSKIAALSKGGYAEKASGGKFTPLSGQRRRNHLLLSAREWVKLVGVVKDTYDNHNPALRTFIKYEELIVDTKNILRDLYKFIDVEIPEERLTNIVDATDVSKMSSDKKGIGTTVQFATSGVWKKRFDDDEVTLIEEIISPGLKQLGYPLSTETPESVAV